MKFPNISAESVSSPNIPKNLNIINLSAPEFSLGEIPLPNNETLKSSIEVPQPVPSPKITVVSSLINTDSIIPKMEPVSPLLSTTIAPVPAVDVTSAELNNTFSTIIVKEEPKTPNENKSSENVLETVISPPKRNLVPIKFLTAELKKQAVDSPNMKVVANVETNDALKSNYSTGSIRASTPIAKSDVETLPLTNRKRHFAMSLVNMPAKRSLLDEFVNDENSADFTDKFIKKDEKGEGLEEVSTSDNLSTHDQPVKSKSSACEQSLEKYIEQRAQRRSRSISPRRKSDLSKRISRRDSRSPSRRESSGRYVKDTSPRRREWEDKEAPRNRKWDRERSPRRSRRDVLLKR